jgi:hypothetical protein
MNSINLALDLTSGISLLLSQSIAKASIFQNNTMRVKDPCMYRDALPHALRYGAKFLELVKHPLCML